MAQYASRWSLGLGAPYEPGGGSAWVAPAVDARGRALALKIGWRHDEAMDEAAALRAWDGHGAARVHASDTTPTTVALLLERCEPGTPLARRPEPEQDEVIATVLNELWRVPSGDHPFRPLSAMTAAWADAFEARLPGAAGRLDPGWAREAVSLLRQLPLEHHDPRLLCTDLHAGNVLAAERAPWLVIDPKPYVGDPSYDVVQHLLNCRARLAADAPGLAHHLADRAGLDRDRVTAWLFARCVQESLDDASLLDVAAQLTRSQGQ